MDEWIPSFASRDYYWNQIPREKMSRLLRIADEDGYRSALQSVLLPETNDYTLRYALDESRADFKFLLPLSRQSQVLDLGCGWGAVSFGLARTTGLVIALDSTYETLQFMEIRARQEKVNNLVLGHIDPIDYGRLPFSSDRFDAAILNGVLEWIGAADLTNPVEQAQNLALREIRRILRPGGTVYIGIENRFSLHYLLGARDEHSGLRFTGVLPRAVAKVYMNFVAGKPYRTYTHSRRGYERLLRQTGFSEIEFYFPAKTYRNPIFLIPLEDERAKQYYVRNLMFKRKARYLLYRRIFQLGFALHLDAFLVPSFAIIGRKSSD